ncbi:SLC13 family permease [Adlercreutzia sp. ZJ304]|uniref:SLC13 family permease n=1 Tax=Adlercreutzia sp. ZJ304 TaxID=2709791 RepID=UPI0013ECF14D|nr:SLC13 family permease [Adlercreutzia sp. ZJ304]
MVYFIREHWMLAAAALAALTSMLVVPPDEAYLRYFDWKTIGCLFCVLAMANALRRIGTFDRIARMAIARQSSPRTLALTIVLTTAAFSMAFTNDVALVIMLPLSASVLVELNQTRLVPAVFALQALAANLCGMVTPFGNPQNLYIYSHFHLGLVEFLTTMIPPFLLSLAGVIAATMLATGKTTTGNLNKKELQAPATKPFSPQMPIDRRRLSAYGFLFVVTLMAVFRIVPTAAAVVVIAGALAIADRKALVEVDYALLATFMCFFAFAGNMSRLPTMGDFLGPLMDRWGLLVSACTSQVISNVPAAVVLSHFTEAWQPLLVGVNIGGAGTFVGSLASLIAIRYFSLARKVFPRLRADDAPTMGHFLCLFGLMNAAFFVMLLAFC